MPDFVKKLIVMFVVPIFEAVSPVLRESLVEMVTDFYWATKKTESEYDDWAAAVLCMLLGIPTPTIPDKKGR